MGLTPVWNEDGWFNAPAAQAAYELVMKMDDAEAEVFMTMVAADTLWETIEQNKRTLQKHLDRVVEKRLGAVAKVLEGREDAEEILKALSPYDYGYRFKETDFNRDRRTGQFKKKVNYTATKPLNRKTATSYGIPNPDTHTELKGVKGHYLAEYQQGYMQVANFLDSFQQQGLAADYDFVYNIDRFTPDGQRAGQYTVRATGTDVPKINPRLERIEGVEARPAGLTAGGAAFGLVSALSSNDRSAWVAADKMNRFNDDKAGFQSFGDSWLNAGDEVSSSNDRLYSRVKTGSEFLGHMSYGNPKLEAAAQFGRLVGQHGPQAEKVIGPSARRAMYRYRGTEKTPDSELTAEYEKAMRSPRNVDGSESGTLARRYVTAYMANKIPNQKLYDLNLKSGHTPPSEGVIIDKNGKLVTQAIGYGDDHYLPFNLKNLSGLKGGEYIRTRSVGGPTSEDIYTGLVTGAQRLTVVSRSGTFVVEFDDTFRGTRRYNDKAGRMVDRYEKLVDAVKSEQVVRTPVEPSVQKEIRAEIERTMGFAPQKERNDAFKRKIEEYKMAPRITAEDEKMIEAQVRQAAGNDERVGNQIRAQLRNQVLESKAYNFRLNGDGYAAALKALEEQFPYYIADVKYAARRDVGTFEIESDKGYVKPRHNRPEGALEGYFDASIAGSANASVKTAAGKETGKYTADTADYQNWKHNPQNQRRGGGSTAVDNPVDNSGTGAPGAATTRGTLTPTGNSTAAGRMAAKIEERRNIDKFVENAVALRARMKAHGAVPAEKTRGFDLMNLKDDEFREQILDNVELFEETVAPHKATFLKNENGAFSEAKEALKAYEAAKSFAGGEPFERRLHLTASPKSPLFFHGEEAYAPAGKIDQKVFELNRVAANSGWLSTPLNRMRDDKEFVDLIKHLQEMRKTARDIHDMGGDAEAIGMLRSQHMLDEFKENEIEVMHQHPEKIDDAIEDTHRAWTLKTQIMKLRGDSLDDLMVGTSGEAGELPKWRNTSVIIPAEVKTLKNKQTQASKFQSAIDQLTREAQQLETRTDEKSQRRLGKVEGMLTNLLASKDEPFSANAKDTWKEYINYINGSEDP